MSGILEENIKVVVRIRPINQEEEDRGETSCVRSAGDGDNEVQIRMSSYDAHTYRCNKCFAPNTSQKAFFNDSGLTNLLDSAIGGYRACAFAFGQTGAGKTYSILGPSSSVSENTGILNQSLFYLFSKLDRLNVKYTLRLSCMEIYKEQVYDLLVDGEDRKLPLQVREHNRDGFFLENCTMLPCGNADEACAFLDRAMMYRRIGSHDMNSRSNRSHCLTDIFIELPGQAALQSIVDAANAQGKEQDFPGLEGLQSEMENDREYTVMGRITLVDLAGSENMKKTNSSGKAVKEAGFINRSLYVLGQVIQGLARTSGDANHRDVPYRDSKLTKLLISSLGGVSRTLLLACVAEASGSQAETLRTLKFSMSCARIKNRPVRFLDPQKKLIMDLRGEIKRLRNENEKLRQGLLSAPDGTTIYANNNNDDVSQTQSRARTTQQDGSKGRDRKATKEELDEDLAELDAIEKGQNTRGRSISRTSGRDNSVEIGRGRTTTRSPSKVGRGGSKSVKRRLKKKKIVKAEANLAKALNINPRQLDMVMHKKGGVDRSKHSRLQSKILNHPVRKSGDDPFDDVEDDASVEKIRRLEARLLQLEEASGVRGSASSSVLEMESDTSVMRRKKKGGKKTYADDLSDEDSDDGGSRMQIKRGIPHFNVKKEPTLEDLVPEKDKKLIRRSSSDNTSLSMNANHRFSVQKKKYPNSNEKKRDKSLERNSRAAQKRAEERARVQQENRDKFHRRDHRKKNRSISRSRERSVSKSQLRAPIDHNSPPWDEKKKKNGSGEIRGHTNATPQRMTKHRYADKDVDTSLMEESVSSTTRKSTGGSVSPSKKAFPAQWKIKKGSSEAKKRNSHKEGRKSKVKPDGGREDDPSPYIYHLVDKNVKKHTAKDKRALNPVKASSARTPPKEIRQLKSKIGHANANRNSVDDLIGAMSKKRLEIEQKKHAEKMDLKSKGRNVLQSPKNKTYQVTPDFVNMDQMMESARKKKVAGEKKLKKKKKTKRGFSGTTTAGTSAPSSAGSDGGSEERETTPEATTSHGEESPATKSHKSDRESPTSHKSPTSQHNSAEKHHHHHNHHKHTDGGNGDDGYSDEEFDDYSDEGFDSEGSASRQSVVSHKSQQSRESTIGAGVEAKGEDHDNHNQYDNGFDDEEGEVSPPPSPPSSPSVIYASKRDEKVSPVTTTAMATSTKNGTIDIDNDINNDNESSNPVYGIDKSSAKDTDGTTKVEQMVDVRSGYVMPKDKPVLIDSTHNDNNHDLGAESDADDNYGIYHENDDEESMDSRVDAMVREHKNKEQEDEVNRSSVSSLVIDFSIGSRIEGNYRKGGYWYPGKIAKRYFDNSFDIDYDDGEKERLPKAFIRWEGGEPPKAAIAAVAAEKEKTTYTRSDTLELTQNKSKALSEQQREKEESRKLVGGSSLAEMQDRSRGYNQSSHQQQHNSHDEGGYGSHSSSSHPQKHSSHRDNDEGGYMPSSHHQKHSSHRDNDEGGGYMPSSHSRHYASNEITTDNHDSSHHQSSSSHTTQPDTKAQGGGAKKSVLASLLDDDSDEDAYQSKANSTYSPSNNSYNSKSVHSHHNKHQEQEHGIDTNKYETNSSWASKSPSKSPSHNHHASPDKDDYSDDFSDFEDFEED